MVVVVLAGTVLGGTVLDVVDVLVDVEVEVEVDVDVDVDVEDDVDVDVEEVVVGATAGQATPPAGTRALDSM